MNTCPKCGKDSAAEARFCQFCGAELAAHAPVADQRKVVTVVFTDVTGSTALGGQLDPESMRHIISRYFDAMRDVIERHGGTVEKFIGDAVMAVFGVPQLHEDDAVRGVRAAVEMREALASLNADLQRERGVTIATRTGVNTGEVVAGGDATANERFVTGDTVNVAARFEEAAEPGEILIGLATYSLVRDAVEVEAVAPLALKGKSKPVPVFRLLSVRAGAAGRERQLASPMVGRSRHLRMLEDSFEAVVSDRSCHLFTVLGSPGVGKSRLVLEFLEQLRGRARVLRGRCLSYGDGITFWPIAEIVYAAAQLSDDDDPAEVSRRIRAVLSDADDAETLAGRIEQLLGLSEANPSLEETFWAIRRLLEHLAGEEPVVVVIDDIHWAKPTLLDLIEHVADWTRGEPVFMLCLARPELLEVRPSWGGGKMNASSILLEPLSGTECEQLIANLLGTTGLPPEARERILKGADGNPLFVEEMLGMLIDDGLLRRGVDGWAVEGDLTSVAVPASIQALLAARLDRLAADERAAIERGSVEGTVFHVGGVEALSPEPQRAGVRPNLRSMVRKELIRPDRTELAGEDAFRFHHLLLRDAAYESMPKEIRADLHERFADWIADRLGGRAAESEAIVAYHLEQAVRYREALGIAGPREQELADRAANRFVAAGEAALALGDARSARDLLKHAASLRPGDPAILFATATALEVLGEFREAIAALDATDAALEGRDERGLQLRAELLRLQARSRIDQDWGAAQHLPEARRLLAAFEELGDEGGVGRATLAVSPFLNRLENLEAATRAYRHAERAGDVRTMADALAVQGLELVWSSVPAEEASRRCEEILALGVTDRTAEGIILACAGCLYAMRGDADRGRSLVARSRSILRDLGSSNVAYAWFDGFIGWFFGDMEAAATAWREGYEILNALGEKNRSSTLAGQIAGALALQGRREEALEMARIGRETGAPDDQDTKSGVRMAEAILFSAAGDHEHAIHLAREAAELLLDRGAQWILADAYRILGDVLAVANRTSEAADAYRQALARYEAKGIVPLIATTRAKLASIA